MGQVSVLVSVFEGETTKPEYWLWLVIYDGYDYYHYGLTVCIVWNNEYPWDGTTSWIFTMIMFIYKPFMWRRSDARLWQVRYFMYLQALYVVSLRCPTVACLLFIYLISPLCGVAKTPDWGMLTFTILSRRRFRHPIGAFYFYSVIA